MGQQAKDEWVAITEIPESIQGRRRRLIEMLLSATSRHSCVRCGQRWKFTFPDSGGWSTVVEIQQDKITPTGVARHLSGEAFSKARFEDETMDMLERLVGKK